MNRGAAELRFEQVAIMWLEYHREDVKESTLAHYRQLLRRHVLPDLGDISMCDVTRDCVDAFLRGKLRAGRLDGQGGLAPKTVADIRAVVMMVLSYARDNELGCQVQGGVFYPRIPRQHISVLSPQEQK